MREKEEGALRIFRALSAADTELLERSEKKQRGIRLRGGRMAAAAACFAALGILAFAAGGKIFGPVQIADEAAMKPQSAAEAAAGTEEKMPEAGTESQSAADTAAKPEEKILTDTGNAELSPRIAVLSREQVAGQDPLGKYVPEGVPQGYTFSGGQAVYSGESGEILSLFVSWTKGMDFIEWIVCPADAEDLTFTDAGSREAYDVSLYEIPYADTVPEEYRESFEAPVFRSSEFTLEQAEARIKRVQDSGDTNSPRGNFGVYLEEKNILIEYKGRAEAGEVYEMFEDVLKKQEH